MDTINDDPWASLARLCRDHKAEHLDILTGFLGSYASQALAELGVSARIILGLPRADAAMSSSQIHEISDLLDDGHEVRWLPGLHAKLYVLPGRAMMIGSANFSRGGFSRLDELVATTTDRAMIDAAQAAFDQRWAAAMPVDPDNLVAHETANSDEYSANTLGTVSEPRESGFTSRSKTVRGSGISSPGECDAPLGVLFVNIGWHKNYDGSSLPQGNHRYLHSQAAQRDSSSDASLFVPEGGYHYGPTGRGSLPSFERFDVIFTAVPPPENGAPSKREIVAIFRDCIPDLQNQEWIVVKATPTRVHCFPFGQRPLLTPDWPGRMSMRRWAFGGRSQNWPELKEEYRRLMRDFGD